MTARDNPLVLLAFAILALLASPALAGDPYRLAPGDTVSVSVLNREDLTTEQTIRRNGTISMHLLGRIKAAGKTTEELESELKDRINAKTGLPVSVVVDVTGWRPVHVLGDVATPGEQRFRPGLTVGRLVAAAGGLYPRENDQLPNVAIGAQILQLGADIAVRKARLAGLHARRLRLEAQEKGLARIEPDAEFLKVAGPSAATLVAEEDRILASQRLLDEQAAESARRRADLSANEAELLTRQQEILRENIADSAKELAKMESLLERGLTSSDRVRQLRSTQNDDKIELMQAGSFKARALQTRQALLDSIEQQKVTRQNQTVTALEQVLSDIRDEEAEIAAAEQTIAELSRIASGGPILLPPAFRIFRPSGDGQKTIPADLHTPIQPGDLLEVRRGGFDEEE